MGPGPIWWVPLQGGLIQTCRETPVMHVHRRGSMGHSEKVDIYKARRKASGETKPCQHLGLGLPSPRTEDAV